jgi:hypothetical protein
MAIDSSDNNVRETRALAHELWSQCKQMNYTHLQSLTAHMYAGRYTTSQYQELTADLKKLRNLLEDVEEHVVEDFTLDLTSCQISTPILQCKAILRGLDLIWICTVCKSIATTDMKRIQPQR